MGMREQLMIDFEDKTLQYQDKKFYILKQFEHKNTLYLYGVDIDSYQKEELEYAFLYRIDRDIFGHVEDEKLWEELFDIAAGLCAADIVKKNLKN